MLAAFKALVEFPRGATLDQLASRLSSPKSSTHRALATLRRAGLADQSPDGTYRLGFEALRLAFSFYEKLDERIALQPVLDELASRFGETAHYAQLRGGEVVYVAKVTHGDHGVYMASRVGSRNPAHATGVGKLLLAHTLADLKAVQEYARRYPLHRRTAATICEPAALHEELELTRSRGYAMDMEENELDVGCVALPIFLGPSRYPSGAVSVATLLHRTTLESIIEGIDEMRAIIGGHLSLHDSQANLPPHAAAVEAG